MLCQGSHSKGDLSNEAVADHCLYIAPQLPTHTNLSCTLDWDGTKPGLWTRGLDHGLEYGLKFANLAKACCDQSGYVRWVQN